MADEQPLQAQMSASSQQCLPQESGTAQCPAGGHPAASKIGGKAA